LAAPGRLWCLPPTLNPCSVSLRRSWSPSMPGSRSRSQR
jgi:hypothetical protein